ncbi:hypothetical protein M3G91_09210 [Micromonospora chalcea]|uniref:hypothetical protein n=1 Tax=Micromonospora chalcea TaxID=1874 RepID=UPI0021A80EE2|nr:hypothetical protein [Micromonospora chalcea]MCT2277802.1 hypothetical protein [Micromonospora chalcea]
MPSTTVAVVPVILVRLVGVHVVRTVFWLFLAVMVMGGWVGGVAVVLSAPRHM